MTDGKQKMFKVLTFFIMFLSFMFVACMQIDGPKQSADVSSSGQYIKNFTIKDTKNGELNWLLESSLAEVLDKEKKVYIHQPNIKFYDKGKYTSNLIAKSGRVNTQTGDIWGDGECVLNTSKGEKLQTRNIHYMPQAKLIVTKEAVTLYRQKETINGTGMEATPDLQIIRIKNQRVMVK
jgi:LPS export ABC transporter protein LptC